MFRALTTAFLLTTLLGATALAETVEVKMLNKSGKETMVFEPAFVKIAVGDTVKAGQPVASIEAMKMEAAITSPVDGVVERLAIAATQQVDAGDLLVVIRPAH